MLQFMASDPLIQHQGALVLFGRYFFQWRETHSPQYWRLACTFSGIAQMQHGQAMAAQAVARVTRDAERAERQRRRVQREAARRMLA